MRFSMKLRRDRLGDLEQGALIGVKRKLVHFDVAAFAGEGVGVGGEAVDAAAIGELEDVGAGVFLSIEEELAFVGGEEIEEFGPVAAVFEIEEGLGLVARGDPDVEAGFGGAGFEDGIKGVGFGGTDLAGFFPDAQDGVVHYPFELGGEEPDASGKRDFGVIWLRLVEIG